MPLSDHEQRLLSEMEERLLAEDPRFASAMRHATTGGASKQRLALGALGILAGLAVMIVALYHHLVPVAVVGFVIMLASAYGAVATPRRKGPQGVVTEQGGVQSVRRTGSKRAGRPSGSFVQRMERRWERRQPGA